MSLKIGLLCSFVALCLFYIQVIHCGKHFDPNMCSYTEVCRKTKIIHGITVHKKYLCKKHEPCETTWGTWSLCTVTCGGGWRKRVGKCVGTKCHKWKKDIERCNPDPCPTPPPPPPTTTTTPTPTTTPEPDDCDTTWTKVYEHEADGTATFGNLTELSTRVSTGGSIKVWDRQDDVLYTGQTVLERDGHLCTQVFFDLSISAFDTFEALAAVETGTWATVSTTIGLVGSRDPASLGSTTFADMVHDRMLKKLDDVFWSFDFLCTTGNRMETRYNVGEQVNRGITRDRRRLTWFVRDIVPDKPLYANAVNGTVLEGSVQNLVDSILRGEDFRLTIGNGLRIPAANIEFQGEGNDTLVTEMGIFESSRQVVDSGGIDIYEFLANGMDVWWFTVRSSAGRLNLDRWKIGEHERTQTETCSTCNAEWYADSCWRQIYKRNADGSNVTGSLADLISAAESGKRVRVLIGTLNLEADDVRIENGVLCGSFLNRLTKGSFETLDPDIAWFWTIACASGTVRFLKYKVGNTDLVDFGTSTEALTWFVDDRVWTKVLETGSDGSEVSGTKSEFLTAVQNGGDIRYRIHVTDEIEGFALPNTTIIQQADNLRWSGNDVGAMHVRSVGIASAGLNDVDFIRNQYWCFSIVSTNGKLEVSRWFAGVHTSKGKTTNQVSVEWYVNT